MASADLLTGNGLGPTFPRIVTAAPQISGVSESGIDGIGEVDDSGVGTMTERALWHTSPACSYLLGRISIDDVAKQCTPLPFYRRR
jgi:hypothetical protein